MTTFAILGPSKSQSVIALAAELGIQHLFGRKVVRPVPDVLINYGYRGKLFRDWEDNNPALAAIPMINRGPIHNKFATLTLARDAAVPIPETPLNHGAREYPHRMIAKPFYSGGGKNIYIYDGEVLPGTHYLQKYIENRLYEVRVSGSLWTPQAEWGVWKKRPGADMKPDQIVWNHDQGGVFQRVRNPEQRVFAECKHNTDLIFNATGLQFGAVDFIVDADRNVYFIELNTRPGFMPEYGDHYYYDMFHQLLEMSYDDIIRLIAAEDRRANVVGDNVVRQSLRERLATTIREWEVETGGIFRDVEGFLANSLAQI